MDWNGEELLLFIYLDLYPTISAPHWDPQGCSISLNAHHMVWLCFKV